ncbi:MAG: dTDP-4-amino-4,6-dideoxygalactose transaminase, partial [Candidatus Obscuribacterales bacterium]
MDIPFNAPYITGHEIEYIKAVLDDGHLCGDGKFSQLCHAWLEDELGCASALLTPSGTAALELAALLLDIRQGDEVIMPSFTFVSTANAFVLRGAQVVFVDIRPDTLNIDQDQVAKAITSKTRAIVPVHYAGIGCDMPAILRTAQEANVAVVEDAAHAIMSTYDGKPLGSFGSLAALSFHETKNLVAGEAGALIINDENLVERAEIIREKGTNRNQFFRGQIDKYTWQALGSSYLPSELQAAFLWAQMEQAMMITASRQLSWEHYHKSLEPLEQHDFLRRPIVPELAMQNGHIYYVLTRTAATRNELMDYLRKRKVSTVFHY